jgi:small-conductance mechanosensitive channel
MRPRLLPRILAGLLVAGATGWGVPAGAQLKALPAANLPRAAATEATALRSPEEIAREHAAAKAALAGYEAVGDAPADAPPGTPALEIASRLSLARQLVSILQQQLDALARAEEARTRLAEVQRQQEQWRGFDSPPPHSVLLVDALRDEVENSQAQVEQAQARRALFARVESQLSDQFRDSQGSARLAAEAADRARGTAGAAALEWKRALAVLQARLDGETQALLQLAARTVQVEEAAAAAASAFARRKLADAGTEFSLPPADLEKVLARIEGRQRAAERDLERATRDSQAASEARGSAERRLAEARSAPPRPGEAPESREARLAELELEASARHEIALNASGRIDLLREYLVQLDGESAVWKARAAVVGANDPVRARAAYDRLTASLAGVRSALQYLRQRVSATEGRIREVDARKRAALASDSPAARRLVDALRQREESLRRAIERGEELERLLSRFRADFEERRAASFEQRAQDAVAGAWLAARRAWNYELLTLEDTYEAADGRRVSVSRSVTVGKTFGAALIVLLGYWIAKLLAHRVERMAVARGRATPQTAALVRQWVLFLVTAVLVIVALVGASIPLTAFAFLGGALAIAAGFGLQNLLKNLVSGVMLLVERPLRLGDLVEVDGVRGRITEIGVRASTLRTADGIESIIPNSRFIEGSVTNWTFTSPTTRQSISVGVAYGTDLRAAAAMLAGVLDRHGLVLKNPPPQVYLEEFADSAVNFALTYWVELTPESDPRRVKSDLLHMIDRAFAEAGVAIPFPQRDVHLDLAGPVPVSVVPSAAAPASGPAA